MRASRLLIAVIALALLGLVPAASATAAKPDVAGSSARFTSAPPVSAKVNKLTAKIVKRRNGNLFLTGVIRPKQGPIVIQKATNCSKRGVCNFKKFTKTRPNNKGRYSVRVPAPRRGSFAFRAKKNATTSQIWLTCVQRAGSTTCPRP